MMKIVTMLLLSATLMPAALAAQTVLTPVPVPMAVPLPDAIPAAVDTPYPGTMTVAVDASNVAQGVFAVRQTIPVAKAGPMVLLYPEWKPGNHAPSGQIKRVAGLHITVDGKPIAWIRDTVDMFAFHVDVPAGTKTVEASFQFVSALSEGADRVVAAPAMVNLQWDAVSLYPAGYYVRGMKVKASATYPAGWTAFTALRGTRTGDRTDYETVGYDVLLDSPVFAGANAKAVPIGKDITLDLVADTPDLLAITPDQIAAHKALVVQADKLFGARHYDHYDLLVALSDIQSADGLEHHRSSENTLSKDLLTDWKANVGDRYVVAHEYTHSWNGKYRRPADLWTPDYRTPMQDSLLWVYEGQTQFWGDVLAARSGLWSKQEYLDILAMVAAGYTEGTPGAAWRPLQDTTNDPIQTGHADPSDWPGWSRGYDYYRNSELIWLEVDQTLRAQTGGKRGLDDFAHAFFGVRPGEWNTELTYTFADVAAALNAIAPYDWARFLRQRLDGLSPATTLAGIAKGGYRLVFTDTLTDTAKAFATKRGGADFGYSLGLATNAKGNVRNVGWNSPAFASHLKPGDTIVAVAGLAYTPERLAAAVTAAKTDKAPIVLLVQDHDDYRTVTIDYHGGLRYPRLEKVGTGETGLDRLLMPR